jgi:nucleotide-binding universal stress UspA family protein
VLSTAGAVAKLFGAEAKALHVGLERPALSATARRAGIDLENVAGDTAPTLARAVSRDDFVAVVIGARGKHPGKRPAGHTALSVITLEPRPVVVVPPDAPPPCAIESVLMPLDGTAASAAALEEFLELAHDAALRIVVAHVLGTNTLPAFSDHLPHEARAWSDEFIARHCPTAPGATLELRVGEPREHLLDILRQSACDLVALGWRQDLARGRAAVVRRMLAESPVPVLLTPVKRATARSLARATEREAGYRIGASSVVLASWAAADSRCPRVGAGIGSPMC